MIIKAQGTVSGVKGPLMASLLYSLLCSGVMAHLLHVNRHILQAPSALSSSIHHHLPKHQQSFTPRLLPSPTACLRKPDLLVLNLLDHGLQQ